MNALLARYMEVKEEELAAADDPLRDCGAFRLGSFESPDRQSYDSADVMAKEVRARCQSADEFYGSIQTADSIVEVNGRIEFSSALRNGANNDRVEVTVDRPSRKVKHAIVIVPHWNARHGSYKTIAISLRLLGFAVYTITLPHHQSRNIVATSQVANEFLNADLGCAIRSVRQSVADVRSLVHWLDAQGYRQISLIGVSLGSCIGALAYAFEPRIGKCALLLTAGDFGEVVWTGRATSHIRKEIEKYVTFEQLREIWCIISPLTFVSRYRQDNRPMLIVSALYDKVVLYRSVKIFVDELREAKAKLTWRVLPCGHYTLGKLPFSVVALGLTARFLMRR